MPCWPPSSVWLTLVELLLVLAIIDVLMGVAIPKYNEYQERIKQAQAIEDIQVIQTLIKHYALDSGSYVGLAADYS